MPDVEVGAVLAGSVTAFLVGAGYYGLMTKQLARVSNAANNSMPPWKILAELARCVALAAVVAWLAARGDVDEWTGGLVLGAVLWLGFPVVLWSGAIMHEGTPVRLAAIHAGDWLLKLLLIGAVVSAWQ